MAFQFCERNGRDYIELIENYRTRDIKRIDICKMPRRSVLIDGDVAIRYIEKSSKATISDDTKIIITATKSLTNFLIDWIINDFFFYQWWSSFIDLFLQISKH